MANRSRESAPPIPGQVTQDREPEILPPFPGTVSKDAPAPLEGWWRQRLPFQHPIPYDHLTVKKSLRIYDAMLLDETVAYAHKLKITSRLSSGWSLQQPTDRDGDPLPGSEEPLNLVQEAIERWDRFDEFLEQMLDGTRQGFKLGEIVTKDGRLDGKQAWVIDDVLVRNSRFFAFDVGPSGRILDDGILEFIDPNPDGDGIMGVWSPAATARHSPEKFVRWTYSPPDSNGYGLYGRSDFHAAYRGFFLGDNLLKGLGETLDTYKHPIAVGIAKKGLTDGQRALFLNALEMGLKRKALVIPGEYIPEGMDPEKAVRFHEVTGKAADFIKALGYLDTAKMRALLVGQLVAETGGDGRGSYALGKQHVSIFLRVMSWIGKSLGSAVMRQLFRRVVAWNLGIEAAELTPALVWHAAGDAESLERAQIIQTLIDAGAVDGREEWIRDYVGQFPRMDEDLAAQREDENNKRLEAETRPPPAAGAGGPPKGKAGALAAGAEPRADGVETEDPPRALFHEERKLDDTGVAPVLEDLIDRAERDWYGAWARVFDGPGGVMAWGRVALRANGTPALRIDTSRLEALGEWAAVAGIVVGAIDAFVDVKARLDETGVAKLELEDLAAKPKPKPKAVFEFDLDTWAKGKGVNIDARLRDVARRVRIPKDTLERAVADQMKALRAKLADEKQRLIDEAKAAVGRARSEKGRAARTQDLRDLRAKWRGIDRDLGNQQSALVETLTNRAYGLGRDALYDAMPKGLVLGFLYSAIRDDRTTEFCRAWDGFRAPKDHPVWARVSPPNHYRCRSKKVAVLAGEATPAALAAAARHQPRVPKPGGGLGF